MSFRRNRRLPEQYCSGKYTRQSRDEREYRCRLCQIKRETERKLANRFRVKAQQTRDRHAQKYGMKSREFSDRFGWNIDEMARDCARAYDHECPYCNEKFAEELGLGNITLDILNRDQDPIYRTNTRWVCRTCNMLKGQMTPDEWGQFTIDREKWLEIQRKLKMNPFAMLPLFGSNHALAP